MLIFYFSAKLPVAHALGWPIQLLAGFPFAAYGYAIAVVTNRDARIRLEGLDLSIAADRGTAEAAAT